MADELSYRWMLIFPILTLLLNIEKGNIYNRLR